MYEEKIKARGKRSESTCLVQIPRIMKWEASDLDEAFEKVVANDATLSFKWNKLTPTPDKEELIPSLKEMNEGDELDHQPEETRPETEKEEPTSKQAVAKMEPVSKLKQLEEENNQLHDVLGRLAEQQEEDETEIIEPDYNVFYFAEVV